MKLTKAVFMFRRLLTDLVEGRHIPLHISDDAVLGYYYIRFEEDKINSRGGNKPFEFDANGVPQIHSYIDVEAEKGYYYYPITIGQYALAVFHAWLDTNDEAKKAHFLRIADWFKANAVIDEHLGAYWLTETPKPEFNMHTPWKSAFSQSRAISILLRAWQVTSDTAYLKLASLALQPYLLDTQEGGVRVDGDRSRVFYEEYVASAPTRILDGGIFALWGVLDYLRAVKEEPQRAQAQQILADGLNGLKAWLPDFDMGYWVYYNRCDLPDYPPNDPCTIGYLRLVVAQLRVMHGMTRDTFFAHTAKRFTAYLRLPNILRMYFEKYRALKKLNRL